MEREPIDWQVRSPRRGVSLVGTVCQATGRTFRVLITNLSYEGCTVIAEQPLYVGEPLSFSVPNQGALQAQVRWVEDEKAGIRFLTGDSAVEQRRARLGV